MEGKDAAMQSQTAEFVLLMQSLLVALNFQTSSKRPHTPVLPHDAQMSNMKLISRRVVLLASNPDSSQKILKMDAKWNLFDTAWPVMRRGMKGSLCAPVHNAESLLEASKCFQPQGYYSIH